MSYDPRFGRLTHEIIGACIDIHSELGPGLLESVYERLVAHELGRRKLHLERQVSVPLVFRGLRIERAYVADFVVEGTVVVELKAVAALTAVHRAQVRTYLKLLGLGVGLLVHFNVPALRQDGIRRINLSQPPLLPLNPSTSGD